MPKFWVKLATFCAGLTIFCVPGVAQYTPTISGVFNAFWYLGPGILNNGGSCSSGQTGPCYYAQSQLTADPNGAPGTPSWSIVQPGAGQISLSCYTCTNPIATALAPSSGCSSDIQVTVSYGSYTSAPFNITIVVPNSTVLQSTYPQHSAWNPAPGYNGYQSLYVWAILDSCSNQDGGIDANEALGSFSKDQSNTTWVPGSPNGVYLSSYLIGDIVGFAGPSTAIPVATAPASPLGSHTVINDNPWKARVGSQSIGSGTQIRSDKQQWWQDHGTHQ
jgi:hypothetical protein